MAIAPNFPWVSRRRATALIEWTLVGASGGMRVDFVGPAPDDINAAAIGFSAGNAGRKMLVGINKASIMLFFGRIDR